jgi:methionine sulfoxide reductase catalytic subunit
VQSFRSQLTTGEDAVDPATWAGAVPQAHGIAPRIRVGHSRWFNLLWLLPIGFVVLIVAVAAAKGLRATPSVARFIERYPGTVEATGSGGSSLFQVGLVIKWMWSRRGGLTGGVIVSLAA